MKRQQQLLQEINQQPGIHIHLDSETNVVRSQECDEHVWMVWYIPIGF